MKAWALKHWGRIRSSFWFLPSLMAGAAVVLAFATVALDREVTESWLRGLEWVYSGGAEGASAVLQTIAGSMITIAGVVFSLTLVALSLASSQFGPRLLRNFMRDTTNQLVLGTFIATFLYCMLVLRTIRRAEEDIFVPHLSVSLGVLFAIASLWVLIYFIHHVSVSIQADEIVARVGKELIEGIERLFPEQLGRDGPLPPSDAQSNPDPMPAAFDREARAVGAEEDGYLQFIDAEALMAAATKENVLVRVELRPGHYVVKDSPVVRVWPGSRLTDELAERVKACFVLDTQRTPVQDIEFSVDQLVEIAARALSPGINDPFTAITCVDRLGSALCRLAQREMPAPYRFDRKNQLRIVAPAITFEGIVDAAFNQIRQHSRANAAVAIRLLETILVVAGFVHREEDREALRRHARMIVSGAREGLPEAEDRRAVEARYLAASRMLDNPHTHA
ncbi:MAG: DUF2254 domain-containing protein [Burkholderiales bacterium]